MQRALLCLLSIILCTSPMAAEHVSLKGKVLDSKSKPLPYASVFLKHHPQLGSVSDDKGRFDVVLVCEDIHTMDTMMQDTLIISMLGYETIYEPVSDFHGSGTLTLRMKEFRYTLDEAEIKASRNDRKQHRLEMKRTLEQIYRRLATVDSPKGIMTTYGIVSDIIVLRDSIPITEDHLTGSLTAIPEGRQNGRDSVSIEVTGYSNYMDSSVRNGIQNLDADKFKKKERRTIQKQVHWDKTIPHKAVWTIVDVKKVLKNASGETRYWDSIGKDDSTMTVCYSRKQGFMGIISATSHMFMTVDRDTYAIRSASCDINVRLNLPFGYKLNPGELEILNMVNLNEEDLEKYKIKTAAIRIKGMVINREKGDMMMPSEKSMRNTASISDRKDRKINLTNTCTLRVLD